MVKVLARLVASNNRDELERALRWLYSFVRPYKWAVVGLLTLSVSTSGLVLLQPWLTKVLIDNGLLAKNFSVLLWVSLAMVFVAIISTAIAGINRYLYIRLSGRILFDVRYELYAHLQTLSPRFYQRWRSGDLLTRLDGDVAEIQRFALDALFAAITSSIGLLGASVLLVMLSWKLSLLVLVLLPLQLIWLRWMRKKVEVHTRRLREKATDLSAFFVETLPAMKFVQLMVQEKREENRLRQRGDGYLQQLLTLQLVEFFTQAVPSTLTTVMRAVAFIVGGYWVINGQWHLGALIAYGTYLGMVVAPAQSLLGLYVAIQRMTVSLHRVMELRLVEPLITEPSQPQPLPVQQAGKITLDHIRFAHPGRNNTALLAGNLTLPQGKKIVFQAPSGAGKSTFIDLLQRFYDPDEGIIFFNGVDLKQLKLRELRQNIVVVSQDVVLFKGTLAENLRYAAPQASDEELLKVVKQARLESLLAELPNGLHSELAERGQQLSGGQKQRIAIARALLMKPQVLVFDEATSAIDTATEAAIWQEVDGLFNACTRLYITHRALPNMSIDYQLTLVEGNLLLQPVANKVLP